MNKWGIIALCMICLLFGYSAGFTAGASFAIEKGLNAASVLLDVKLTGKARQMVEMLPEIMLRLDEDTKKKLNLTDIQYKNMALERLNETLIKSVENKYGK